MDPRRPDALAAALLAFYDRVRRPMPWRERRDAYAIWLSEVMLQQTQVVTVIPYFDRFMSRFPTVADLAGAPEDEVLKLWEGLGYYSRARNLHAAAKAVASLHGGAFPDTADGLRALPGVGEYTAGAVASIAFGRHAPAVDGNVIRVASRVMALEADAASPLAKRAVREWATALVEAAERPGDLNQALMELGATVCTPKKPECAACPVRAACRAEALGTPTRYPIKAARAKVKEVEWPVAVIRDPAGRLWLTKRPAPGVWAGLWAPPIRDAAPESGAALAEALGERFGLKLTPRGKGGSVRHALTHRKLLLTAWRFEAEAAPGTDGRWADEGALAEAALPVPIRALLEAEAPGPLFARRV